MEAKVRVRVRKISDKVYDALQFTGDNVKECIQFLDGRYLQHFPIGGVDQIRFTSFEGSGTIYNGNYILKSNGDCQVVTETCLMNGYAAY